MNEITLEVDCWMNNGLKEYLLSLSGILEVNITETENFLIHVRYNPKLTNYKIIKMEILLFLETLKVPAIVSFDKHTTNKTKNYNIHIKDLCCEWCLKGMIDDLLMTEGIEKAYCNLEDIVNKNKRNITIPIVYNPNKINEEEIKKLEIKLNS